MSVHTNTFDSYAFHIQINMIVVLLPITLQMLPCRVGQPPVIIEQPDCYTWLPSGQPPSKQIGQALIYGDENITIVFLEKYNTCYNSVPTNDSELIEIQDVIDREI